MADPWQVVSQTPTQSTPPPAAPSGDPWQVVSQTPTGTAPPAATTTTPTAEPSMLQRGLNVVSKIPIVQFGIGGLKSLEEGLGGAVQAGTQGSEQREQNRAAALGVENQVAPAPTTTDAADRAGQVVSDWLKRNTQREGFLQKSGAFGEVLAELAAGNDATRAATLPESLIEMGRTLKAIETTPMLQRIVAKAFPSIARSSTELGAQTYARTGGDPEATAASAATGGVLGGLGELVSKGVDVLKPTTETLEGVETPVLANQRTNAPIITKLIRRASDIPAVDTAQQAVPDQVINNGAQRALKNVLDQVNETRQIQGPAEASGTEPGTFKFTVDPVDPRLEAEPLTGANVQQNTRQLGSTAATIPQRLQDAAPISDSQARLQDVGSIGSTIPQRVMTGTTAAEPFETTDPNVVQKLLTEAQRVAANPDIGPRLANRVGQRIASLSDQLEQYHAAQEALPNFSPIDVPAAMENVHDYGTAGDILQNSVRGVYQRMNAATDGEMSTLLRQPRWKSADRMAELFDQHSGQFTPQEWRAASDTYRKGFVLQDLHNAIQKAFTTTADTARDAGDLGATRRFVGSEKIGRELDSVIADNGDDIREMIGDEGIRSLRRMNTLLKGPETGGPLVKLVNNIAAVMRRHGGPVAGVVGHTIAPFLGISGHAGALSGVAAGEAISQVVNRIASNPAIADRVAYAVQNGVSPRLAAPLIASMFSQQRGAQ